MLDFDSQLVYRIVKEYYRIIPQPSTHHLNKKKFNLQIRSHFETLNILKDKQSSLKYPSSSILQQKIPMPTPSSSSSSYNNHPALRLSLSFSLRLPQVSCLSRSTIIARGQYWVDKHTGTHDGDQTDCSGFVSMCWELPKDRWSYYFLVPQLFGQDYQQLVATSCEGHHVVLFAGWKDSGKTEYIDMEEYDVVMGTVKKVVSYPYFNLQSCFHPVKANNIC